MVSPNISRITSSADHLLLKGFVFDVIAETSEPALDFLDDVDSSEFSTPKRHLTVLQEWEERALAVVESDSPYCDAGAALEGFWRTVIADNIGGIRATDEAVNMFNVWSDGVNRRKIKTTWTGHISQNPTLVLLMQPANIADSAFPL